MSKPKRHTKLYKIRFRISIPDPEMPQPRYHTTLFLQTPLDALKGTGTTHHVTGDLVGGMVYQKRRETRMPEEDEMFFESELVGVVMREGEEEGKEGRGGLNGDGVDTVEVILRGLETPGKQKRYNHRTGRTEQFKPGGGFYEIGEGRPTMWKCTEWIVEKAIPALRESGILVAEN